MRQKNILVRVTNDFFNEIFKPKFKVAITSYYYKPSISGVGIHVQNLAKNLVKLGCEVHVFCNSDEENVYNDEGIIVHSFENISIPIKNNYSKKRLEYDLFESEVIKAIIRENQKRPFDIIHSHGSLTKAAFISKKILNIKWIHTFHAIEKNRIEKLSKDEKEFSDLITWIESNVNYSDGAIYVSKALKKESKNHYSIKKNIVIYNGIDLEIFKYSEIKRKNVLFIGRFSKEKGIHFMPELIEEVMSIENTTFTIIAPYKSLSKELQIIRNKLTELENTYGLRLNIISDTKEKYDISNYYKNCQVYIQPSSYESFGLCIIEAMATGRPVVAFKVGGIPEVIENTGILVKTKKEFINGVKELLLNESKALSFGIKARARAELFDWNKIAVETKNYYELIKNGN